MKENYIHDKIRKHEEIIDTLKKDMIVLKDKINFFDKEKWIKDLSVAVSNSYEKIQKKQIDDICYEVFDSRVNDLIKHNYDNLREFHKKNAIMLREYVEKFCKEVLLARKDQSIIMSILVEKGITTEQEMNEIDNVLLKEMKKSDVMEHLKDLFMPRTFSERQYEKKKQESDVK